MSDCPNIVECCDLPVFPTEPTNPSALSGLLWQLPCTSNPNPFSCPCTNPPDQIAQLKGNFQQVYAVTVLIRGVAELANYIGGIVIGGTNGMMKNGGVYDNSGLLAGHNLYSLSVSNPAATYFLNQWDGIVDPNPCYVVRYSAIVLMKAGATISLHCDGINGTEATNMGNLVVTPLMGEPPINPSVIQPINGQFAQLDVLTIV